MFVSDNKAPDTLDDKEESDAEKSPETGDESLKEENETRK